MKGQVARIAEHSPCPLVVKPTTHITSMTCIYYIPNQVELILGLGRATKSVTRYMVVNHHLSIIDWFSAV